MTEIDNDTDTDNFFCADCGNPVKESDIIGDGTSRALCCVPDYYNDQAVDYFNSVFNNSDK